MPPVPSLVSLSPDFYSTEKQATSLVPDVSSDNEVSHRGDYIKGTTLISLTDQDYLQQVN